MTKNEHTARELLDIKARFHDSPTVGKLIAAWKTYLDEQFPIPADLEAAVRDALQNAPVTFGQSAEDIRREGYDSARSPFQIVFQAVAGAVAPLLAERDKRIEKLEGKTREWHDILVHQIDVLSQPIPLDIKPDEEAARDAAQSLESPDD